MFEKSLAPALDEHRLGNLVAVEEPSTFTVSIAGIRLDPARPSDEPFLYRTFASTRSEEMALTGWNAEQQDSFLRMQYEAQRRSYVMQIPNAEYSVIHCEQTPVGRLIVERTNQGIHVVDIALLPQFRGHGIGSILMEAIMKEASEAAKTVSLHVERFNPALQWYERLGFSVVHSGPIYLEMVWQHGSPSSSRETKSEVGAEHGDLSD